MSVVFNVFYETKNHKNQWVFGRQTEYRFSLGLECLNRMNILAQTRPDLYKNVTCDFQELLEDVED